MKSMTPQANPPPNLPRRVCVYATPLQWGDLLASEKITIGKFAHRWRSPPHIYGEGPGEGLTSD